MEVITVIYNATFFLGNRLICFRMKTLFVEANNTCRLHLVLLSEYFLSFFFSHGFGRVGGITFQMGIGQKYIEMSSMQKSLMAPMSFKLP